MAIKIIDAMDRTMAGIEGVSQARRRLMYAVGGDAQYLTPVKSNGKQQAWQGEGNSLAPGVAGKQQQWQGEGDSPASPPKEDPYARHRQIREKMFPRGSTTWDRPGEYTTRRIARPMPALRRARPAWSTSR